MIKDSLLELSPAQVLDTTSAAYTAEPSTNHIDVGATRRALGSGRPLFFVVKVVDTGAAGGGDGSDTFQVSLVTDDVDAFNVNKTTVVAIPQQTLAAGAAIKGLQWVVPIPPGAPLRRYLRAEIAATQTVQFTVNIFITDQEPYDHNVYPDAI